MIKEAIEAVQKLTKDSLEVTIIPVPGRGDKAILNVRGEAKEISISPPARSHCIGSLESFCEAIATWGDECKVFVNDKQAVAVLRDVEDRRDTLTMPLKLHPQFAFVKTMKGQQQQKQIVRWLRHDLAGCVPEGLVSIFRVLEFKRSNDGSSRTEHGRESLGRSVEAAVNNAENIPETFNLTVPVLDIAFSTAEPIRCSVDIDVAAGTIAIDPVPGQLEQAMRNAIENIGKYIAKQASVGVFSGSVT